MTADASTSVWGATLDQDLQAVGGQQWILGYIYMDHLELVAVLKAKIHCFTRHLRMRTIALHLGSLQRLT